MKKYALLIGIEQYGPGLTRLQYACRDVYGIGQALTRTCGFDQVRILADQEDRDYGQSRMGLPIDSNILTALEDATVRLEEDDLFLFLFAGHGVELIDGEIKRGYLLAQNAVSKFRRGYIEIAQLKGLLSNLACRRRMILLDCCRNEPEAGRSQNDNVLSPALSRELVDASIRPEGDSRTTILMMACRSGQRAYEWEDERHGVFSYYLKQGIEEAGWQESQLEGRALCAYVERKTSEWAQKKQLRQRPEFQQLESAQSIVLASRASISPKPAEAWLECSLCGRNNLKKDVFRCKQCQMDNLCLGHLNENHHCCQKCAAAEEMTDTTQIKESFPKVAETHDQPWKEGARQDKAELAPSVIGPPSNRVSWIRAGWMVLLLTGAGIFGNWFFKSSSLKLTSPSPHGLEQSALSPKSTPWTNSLGMVFLPVTDTNLLVSIWETRVLEYQQFVTATGAEWKRPSFEQGPTHPAVYVSWEDAQAFCRWLTAEERKAGRIGNSQIYRLPTDREWSMAVGLPEETEKFPRERSGTIRGLYPWGREWPLPEGSGNYSSSLSKDAFEFTSPAGSFRPNSYGLYDLGGNVWEWCEDYYSDEYASRVLRGGAWFGSVLDFLQSSYRDMSPARAKLDSYGFRCVLATTQ